MTLDPGEYLLHHGGGVKILRMRRLSQIFFLYGLIVRHCTGGDSKLLEEAHGKKGVTTFKKNVRTLPRLDKQKIVPKN